MKRLIVVMLVLLLLALFASCDPRKALNNQEISDLIERAQQALAGDYVYIDKESGLYYNSQDNVEQTEQNQQAEQKKRAVLNMLNRVDVDSITGYEVCTKITNFLQFSCELDNEPYNACVDFYKDGKIIITLDEKSNPANGFEIITGKTVDGRLP